jgi:hypothetical protein
MLKVAMRTTVAAPGSRRLQRRSNAGLERDWGAPRDRHRHQLVTHSHQEHPMRTSASAVLAGAATSAVLSFALVGVASAAPAVSPAALFVSPTSSAAGQTVQVSGTCAMPTDGTAFPTVTSVTSPAFSGAVTFINRAPDSFSGTATIGASATDGSYPVTLTCSNGTASSTVQVSGGSAKPTPRPVPTPAATGGETHRGTAGTDSGTGTGTSDDGSATTASDTTDQPADQGSGWTGWEIAGVAVLGLAAAGGGGYAVARRNRRTSV